MSLNPVDGRPLALFRRVQMLHLSLKPLSVQATTAINTVGVNSLLRDQETWFDADYAEKVQ